MHLIIFGVKKSLLSSYFRVIIVCSDKYAGVRWWVADVVGFVHWGRIFVRCISKYRLEIKMLDGHKIGKLNGHSQVMSVVGG